MITGGQRDFLCQGNTVRDVLEDLFVKEPALRIHLLDETSNVRKHILVYVGEEPLRWIGGLDAKVEDRTAITILQAVSGG